MTASDGFEELRNMLNCLVDWAIEDVVIDTKAAYDYVCWKLPFQQSYLEQNLENRAFRTFCVQMLLAKQQHVLSFCRNIHSSEELLRPYVIITEPNLFNSEVGVAFSKIKWESMLYRNVETDIYNEKTSKKNRTLVGAFGALTVPNPIHSIYLSHTIDDIVDDIHYEGGFFALWQDAKST